METKICIKCHKEKSLSEFNKDKYSKDKLSCYCKICKRLLDKEYRKYPKREQRERIPVGFKLCSKCHTVKKDSEFRKSEFGYKGLRAECLDCGNSSARTAYYKNREKEIVRIRKYKEENKDKIDIWRKQYILNNKDKINKQLKIRRKQDTNFKLRCNLACSVVNRLRRNTKSGHTLELLGCDIEFLKKHIESQFKEGMSWENWGRGDNGKGMQEWQIDHIYPCASFDLSNPEEQQFCFHWSNLQPLWATKNKNKLNKIK